MDKITPVEPASPPAEPKPEPKPAAPAAQDAAPPKTVYRPFEWP